MKKNLSRAFAGMLIAAFMALALTACGGTEDVKEDWMFDVGTETIDIVSESAQSYSTPYTIYFQVVGGGDTVMFAGTVTLKTTTYLAEEIVSGVAAEKGWAIDMAGGFLSSLGDYQQTGSGVAGDPAYFWSFSVNGVSADLGLGKFTLRNGDYMKLFYTVYEG
ncbi:MAG: DUF4430 domain-containing protein [Clostridiales bacterium]|jgi:hypothetical protein|nr:DUF4430 domain-containing protein [Clostridiales bacterium]